MTSLGARPCDLRGWEETSRTCPRGNRLQLPAPSPPSVMPGGVYRPLSKRARRTRPPSSRRAPTQNAPSNLYVPLQIPRKGQRFEPCSGERLNPSRRRAAHRNDRVPSAKPAQKNPQTTQTPSHSAAAPPSRSACPGRAGGLSAPATAGEGGGGDVPGPGAALPAPASASAPSWWKCFKTDGRKTRSVPAPRSPGRGGQGSRAPTAPGDLPSLPAGRTGAAPPVAAPLLPTSPATGRGRRARRRRRARQSRGVSRPAAPVSLRSRCPLISASPAAREGGGGRGRGGGGGARPPLPPRHHPARRRRREQQRRQRQPTPAHVTLIDG